MKNKFLILSLLLVGLSFTACSKDDDGGSNADPIIGTWKYSSSTEGGVAAPLNDCEKQTTWTFSANGTYSIKDYYDVGAGCESDEYPGTWENKGNDVYEIIDSEETEPSNINKIVFTNGNKTMTVQGDDYTEVYTRN